MASAASAIGASGMATNAKERADYAAKLAVELQRNRELVRVRLRVRVSARGSSSKRCF